jgi:hypothetical protein
VRFTRDIDFSDEQQVIAVNMFYVNAVFATVREPRLWGMQSQALDARPATVAAVALSDW